MTVFDELNEAGACALWLPRRLRDVVCEPNRAGHDDSPAYARCPSQGIPGTSSPMNPALAVPGIRSV